MFIANQQMKQLTKNLESNKLYALKFRQQGRRWYG